MTSYFCACSFRSAGVFYAKCAFIKYLSKSTVIWSIDFYQIHITKVLKSLKILDISKHILGQKSSFVSGNWPGENFFYHSPTCIVKCVSEYAFSISKNDKQKATKNKNQKKQKKLKKKENISRKLIKKELWPPRWKLFLSPAFRKQEYFFLASTP